MDLSDIPRTPLICLIFISNVSRCTECTEMHMQGFLCVCVLQRHISAIGQAETTGVRSRLQASL